MYEFHVPAHHIPAAFGEVARDVPAKNLILSGVAPQLMKHPDAISYCSATIGGGARLPTLWDLTAWTRAMGAIEPTLGAPGFNVKHYKPNLISNMYHKIFMASTIDSNDYYGNFAYGLHGNNGYTSSEYRFRPQSVRCAWESGTSEEFYASLKR